jgi:hypothetical protein
MPCALQMPARPAEYVPPTLSRERSLVRVNEGVNVASVIPGVSA